VVLQLLERLLERLLVLLLLLLLLLVLVLTLVRAMVLLTVLAVRVGVLVRVPPLPLLLAVARLAVAQLLLLLLRGVLRRRHVLRVRGGLPLVLRRARRVVGQDLPRVASPPTAPHLRLLLLLVRRRQLLVLRVVGDVASVLCRARRMILYDAVPVVSLRTPATPRLRIELRVGGGLAFVLGCAGRVVCHDLPLRRRLWRWLPLPSAGTVLLCPAFTAQLLVGGGSLIR